MFEPCRVEDGCKSTVHLNLGLQTGTLKPRGTQVSLWLWMLLLGYWSPSCWYNMSIVWLCLLAAPLLSLKWKQNETQKGEWGGKVQEVFKNKGKNHPRKRWGELNFLYIITGRRTLSLFQGLDMSQHAFWSFKDPTILVPHCYPNVNMKTFVLGVAMPTCDTALTTLWVQGQSGKPASKQANQQNRGI